jgi:signal transduction histidine kinase
MRRVANDASPPSADLNLRLLRHLVSFVVDHYTRRELEGVAAAAGIPVTDLTAGASWVSVEQFEILLARCRALMPDDTTFLEACAYKLNAVSGPMKFMLSAVSPVAAYQAGAKNMRLVSSISTFEPEALSRTRVRIRYRTTKRESRLMCLSRQAQIAGLPTLWGLPPAHLDETSCVARGEGCCAYEVRLYEAQRLTPVATGMVLGALGGLALEFGLQASAHWWWFAPIGAALGYLYELRRIVRANLKTQDEINAAYLQMARDEAGARRELFALTQRQKTWGHLMEHEVVGRDDVLTRIAGELQELYGEPSFRLRDRENPVSQIRGHVRKLREVGFRGETGAEAELAVIDEQLRVLDKKLSKLVRLASFEAEVMPLEPQTLDVEPLIDELRSRLRGLVSSRDVRVSVFAVREAPSKVRLDPLLFNRIVDNLLLNAAKHTDQGSIVVEIGGMPGFLTIKVSDTGTGVPEAEMGALFRPLARDRSSVTYGAGLSVVVQLLGRVGGKLDVMTRRDEGTTFWAHFPIDGTVEESFETDSGPDSQTYDLDGLVDRVVTIRRSSEG